MVKQIRVGGVEVVRGGHFLNIFVRKSQQDLLMHALNVCDRENSTVTPRLLSKKGGVAKTECERKLRLGVCTIASSA